MLIKDYKNRIVAELKFAANLTPPKQDTAERLSVWPALFRALKAIPRELLQIDVRYTGLGFEGFVQLTKYQGNIMDIQAALSDYEEEFASSVKTKPVTSTKMIFVSPISEKSPDDGVLSYSTVESVFDLAAIPDRGVVTFRPDQIEILKLVCENQTLFGLELSVLSGVPETDYSADFENATYAIDRVAYLPFLSELRLAAEIGAQLEAQEQTEYDREKATYTRKNGKVKEHSNFLLPDEVSETLDDEELS